MHQESIKQLRAELERVKQEYSKLRSDSLSYLGQLEQAEADLSEALECLRIAETEWKLHMDSLGRPIPQVFSEVSWLGRAARLR